MGEHNTKVVKNNKVHKEKSKEQIDIVRNSYDTIAENYYKQKSEGQVNLYIFKKFISETLDGKILELGCGSGYPVGEVLLTNNYDYQGIDLSVEQINLAHKLYPKYKERFIISEMLEYLKKQNSDTISGVIA